MLMCYDYHSHLGGGSKRKTFFYKEAKLKKTKQTGGMKMVIKAV